MMAIVERICAHADRMGERLAVTFLNDGENNRTFVTYRQLIDGANSYATAFAERSLFKERVVIALPPGPEFIFAFLGGLISGAIPVPVPPLRSRDNRSWSRMDAVIQDCEASAVVSTTELAKVRATYGGLSANLPWLVSGEVEGGSNPAFDPPRANSVAFLQYTSGSTAEPKGVVVRHENLESNIGAICAKLSVDDESIAVGWLPMHHDMGLIGGVLTGLYRGIGLILMSPLHFVQKPSRWLRAISEFRATHSGGPNFAYDACVSRISPVEAESLDLSSWRCAVAGAEPVRPESIDRFCKKFARAKFDKRSFYPCYGLAEATLIVAGGDGRRSPVVNAFDRRELAKDNAVLATSAHCLNLVGSGSAAADHEIAIVNPETRLRCPDGRIGELWVRGPSVASGYWRASAECAENFGVHMASGDTQFLRTGDLGFIHQNELYLVGRQKDVIITYGRKIHPQDVERTVEALVTGARFGSAAAFLDGQYGSESLVIVLEVRDFGSETVATIVKTIVTKVATAHEVRPNRIALVASHRIPRTTSGKLRRAEARAMLARGDFELLGQHVVV